MAHGTTGVISSDISNAEIFVNSVCAYPETKVLFGFELFSEV